MIYHIVCRYLGVHVFSKTGDLCEAIPCPLGPGHTTLTLHEAMPGFLPPGRMTLKMEATSDDAVALWCVEIGLHGPLRVAVQTGPSSQAARFM
jgi:hypothetical protein